MNKPEFVTFTGVDDRTDIYRLLDLSAKYPIEWGILAGESKSTPNRYPTKPYRFFDVIGAKFAVHLCGSYAKSVFLTPAELVDWEPNGWILANERIFNRIQVNSGKYDIDGLQRFQQAVKKPVIMQTRGKAFQAPIEGIQPLFDQSGGKGRSPTSWPVQPSGASLVGYAGGIGPDNLIDVLSDIDAHTFWIDMETKIRDEDDWLDLDKCEAVCKLIWG